MIDEIFEDCEELSHAEARELLYGHKEAPVFSIVKGNPRKLLQMMKRSKIGADEKASSIDELMKMTEAAKMDLPLFSFCIEGKVRAIVLDIESGLSMEQLKKSLDGFCYIAYFSASSEIEKPRLRAVIPLSEDIPAEEFDYCKERLEKAFCGIPDIHSFESRRFFFMPSKKTGCYREANELIIVDGASIDFYKTTGFTAIDRMKMKLEQLKKVGKAESKDMSEDERVQYYLSTEFPLMSGNGDSASSLYTAIVTCLAHEDDATLEEVLDKARSEKWSEKELSRKIKDAKKFLDI